MPITYPGTAANLERQRISDHQLPLKVDLGTVHALYDYLTIVVAVTRQKTLESRLVEVAR